jgi:hypothetical protein
MFVSNARIIKGYFSFRSTAGREHAIYFQVLTSSPFQVADLFFRRTVVDSVVCFPIWFSAPAHDDSLRRFENSRNMEVSLSEFDFEPLNLEPFDKTRGMLLNRVALQRFERSAAVERLERIRFRNFEHLNLEL